MAESSDRPTGPGGFWWVLVAGILGVFVGVGPNSGSQDSKRPNDKPFVGDLKSPKEVQVADYGGPQSVLHAFEDTDKLPHSDLNEWGKVEGYKQEFLIATVPDPIDTHTPETFDQCVAAIQRAAEVAGFILDRSWLPWEIDRHPKKQDSENDQSKITLGAAHSFLVVLGEIAKRKRGDEEATLSFRERYPGVLLFRTKETEGVRSTATANDNRLLVVFLVGENPVSGIHKRALFRSLRFARSAGNTKYRILAPYYSGSQTSLRFVLEDWDRAHPNEPQEFAIIAGAASAVEKDKIEAPLRSGSVVSFHSAQVRARDIQNAIIHYFINRGRSTPDDTIHDYFGKDAEELPGKVCILYEANTGFGASTFTLDSKGSNLIRIPFPISISRTRMIRDAQYRQELERQGFVKPSPITNVQAAQEVGMSQAVPTQGGDMTALEKGKIIDQILAEIHRQRVEYVGVIATDDADILFLIRNIRENCPGVHIFTSSVEIQQADSDMLPFLRGAVVGSTYPLAPIASAWMNSPTNSRQVFPNVWAQGYYNAGVFHLSGHNLTQLADYNPPDKSKFKKDNSSPPKPVGFSPPIWISAIGSNGQFVPLQYFVNPEQASDSKTHYTMFRPIADNENMDLPGFQYSYPMLFVISVAALILFWCWIIWGCLYRWPLIFWGSFPTRDDYRVEAKLYARLLLLSQLILCMAVTLLAAVKLCSVDSGGAFADQLISVALCVCLMVALLALVTLFALRCYSDRTAGFRGFTKAPWATVKRLFDRSTYRRPESTMGWICISVPVAGAISALVTGIIWAFRVNDSWRALLVVRLVPVASGLSIIVPLFFICMGFMVWAYFHLKKLQLNNDHRILNPLTLDDRVDQEGPKAQLLYAEDFKKIEDQLDTLNDRPNWMPGGEQDSGTRTDVLWALGITVAIGAAFYYRSIRTLEGDLVDFLFLLGFLVGVFLAICAFLRLVRMWRLIRKCLNYISLSRISEVFDRLNETGLKRIGNLFFCDDASDDYRKLAIDALRAFVRVVATEKATKIKVDYADEFKSIYDEDVKMLAKGGKLDEDREVDAMRKVSRRIIGALNPYIMTEEVETDVDESGKPPDWFSKGIAFVAILLATYLSQFFVRLRNLIFFVLLCPVLLLVAATSYPFQPETTILYTLVGMTAVFTVKVIHILLQVNQNEVLVKISNPRTRRGPRVQDDGSRQQDSGRYVINFGFLQSFLMYVLPPLLIVAAQVSGTMRRLVDSLMTLFR